MKVPVKEPFFIPKKKPILSDGFLFIKTTIYYLFTSLKVFTLSS